MLGGSVAASLFLKVSERIKAHMHILWIAMLPTSAKHLALSVDTFANCPTVGFFPPSKQGPLSGSGSLNSFYNAGHPQREHETAHGSMQKAIWSIEGSEGSTIEMEGHRFGAQESGAPQLCFMVCKHLGRHAHVDLCRNSPAYCQEADSEHALERILPEPDVPKDWVSHRLHWARMGRFCRDTCALLLSGGCLPSLLNLTPYTLCSLLSDRL